MTTPRVLLSGHGGTRDLNDTVHCKFDFIRSAGVFEPATVMKGGTTETFGGPIRTKANATHFAPRAMSLSGLMPNQGGYAEGMNRLHDFFEAVQGQTSQFVAGSLYLDVSLDWPKQDRFQAHSKWSDFSVSAEAIPSLYKGLYGYAVGVSQGIPVVDDRRDRTELLFGSGTNAMVDINSNGRIFTVYNPGSAPCDLPLLVSGLTASTTYYLKNRDPRAGAPVCFSTGAAVTTFYLSPGYGVKCFPGTNIFQLQSDASGTIMAAGTFKWAIPGYPSPWRYLGNDAARFNDGPFTLMTSRRGLGRVITSAAAGGLDTYEDMAPRIGLASGCAVGSSLATILTSSQGLVIEQSSTNVCLQSEDFATTWAVLNATITINDQTAPDGAITADKVDDASGSAGYVYQSVTVTNDSTWWTWSVFVYKNSSTAYFPEFRVDLSGGTAQYAYIQVNTNTGATATRASVGTVTTNIYDSGDYWRLCISIKNNGSGNTSNRLLVYPAFATSLGGAESASTTGSQWLWGAQLENLPLASSYIKTTTASVTRNADYAALHLPHNYLRHSHDLTQSVSQTTDTVVASDLTKWVRRGATAIVATRDATTADGTATGTTLTLDATGDSIFQRVVPDVRPNSTSWTFAVTLRKPAGAPTSIDLKIRTSPTGAGIYDYYTTTLATTTITFADIPDAISSRTYFVQGTPAATAVDMICEIIGNTGTGSVEIEHACLVQGSLPALAVLTESSNVPLPKAGMRWLNSATQNGYVEFDVVLPPASSNLTSYVFGESTVKTLALYRDSTTLFGGGATKTEPGNTTTAISSVSGVSTTGSATLSIVRSGATPPDWAITYGSGSTSNYPATAFADLFPLTVVGGAGQGTLILAQSGGPPSPNGTYQDTVTLTSGNMLTVARNTNGGVRTAAVDVGSIWDKAKHTVRIEWLNFTRSGTQYMYLRLYIDGVLKSTDSNLVSATVTAFNDAASMIVSLGEVFATIRALTVGSPTWTPGDVPALAV